MCACKPYIVVREINPSPRTFDISCQTVSECDKMVSAICSSKFDVLGNIDYGPYEHNIQVKCK